MHAECYKVNLNINTPFNRNYTLPIKRCISIQITSLKFVQRDPNNLVNGRLDLKWFFVVFQRSVALVN